MSDGITREVYAFNYWPSSQLCMECKHGDFIMGEDLPCSTYTCAEGVSLGACASSCESFNKSKESVQDERFLANDPIDW